MLINRISHRLRRSASMYRPHGNPSLPSAGDTRGIAIAGSNAVGRRLWPFWPFVAPFGDPTGRLRLGSGGTLSIIGDTLQAVFEIRARNASQTQSNTRQTQVFVHM